MSMRIGKALVVDDDPRTRKAANNLLLTVTRQPFDYAGSVVEAVELLKRNNYVCIVAGSEIPAIAGEPPRRQDLENLLDEVDRLKGLLKPPVVCLHARPADMDDDAWTSWVSDMSLKGVVKWVRKPFPSGGRTPDRMLKKVMNGQYIRVVKAPPLTPGEMMAAPLQAEYRCAPSEQVRVDVEAAKGSDCVTARQGSDALGAKLDAAALTCKLTKIVDGCGKNGPLASLPQDVALLAPAPDAAASGVQEASSPPNIWASVPNEPVEIDEFMTRFCQKRTKETRMFRKRALLAAARNKTVTLPPLANKRKSGQANRYFTHDLVTAWQGFIDAGVDLPALMKDTGEAA